MEPRKIIKIIREDIKPGHEAAHERIEAGYVRAFAKTKYPNYLALTTLTGTSEAWFIEPYDSYSAVGDARAASMGTPAIKAELEQLDARDGEVRSGGRVMLATYQKELSLRGDQFRQHIPQMRFVSISTTRIRPGRAVDYARIRSLIMEAASRALPNATSVTYSVTSGAAAGTYLWIRGFASLKEMDTEPGQKPVMDYMSEADRAEYNKLTAEIVLNSESALFAVSPSMSYAAKEMIDADPAFWRPKLAAATAKTVSGTQ